ncbi:hypothetical protein [Streptomyces sp. NPDC127033]|uniref:hypothetical protein n=1 Tax=Streptomyces sp. NPDC127033 TaxID=3347110 RepID=UPI0036489BAF
MAVPRERKDDHLLYADAVGSRGKSGVWFGEREAFQTRQHEVMDAVKDQVNWVALENAVMAVSLDPPGIVVMAPNPSLPGIIVLADGATPENSEQLKSQYTAIVGKIMTEQGLTIETYEDEGQNS